MDLVAGFFPVPIETERIDCRIRPFDYCFSIPIIVGGNSIYPASFCWKFSDLGAGILELDDFESRRTRDSPTHLYSHRFALLFQPFFKLVNASVGLTENFEEENTTMKQYRRL